MTSLLMNSGGGGAYPEHAADVVVSSDDEAAHSSKPDMPTDWKGLVADDAEDRGTASVETLILSPIKTNVPEEDQAFCRRSGSHSAARSGSSS
jgi:hypothetical protein